MILSCLYCVLLLTPYSCLELFSGLNSVQMIEKYGYPCETHYITTEDGYILTYHRIPHGKNNKKTTNKPAVLFMHGLFSSSADFANMGPKKSLGYILADRGYDVWLSNARGNAWSRNHTKLDIVKDAEAWFDFSWHEIGYYDIPAAIDYILGVNKDEKLYFIGHSQGGTAFFAMASTRLKYNEKIKLALLMAPTSYMRNVQNPFGVLAFFVDEIEMLAKQRGLYEIPFTDRVRAFALRHCKSLVSNNNICRTIYVAYGGNPLQIDDEILPTVLTNVPSNAALKQLYHYGQVIRSGGFAQYDYGPGKNMLIYGSTTPPSYNLSLISAPVAFYQAPNDAFVSQADAQFVIKMLPNCTPYKVPQDLFGHVDFLFARNIVKLVYNKMINLMSSYS